MKKRMNRKSNLDEMQEQKLLKVEHNGVWLAFWGLLAVMVIQMLIYGVDIRPQLAGEWVVFMCLAIYMLIGCIRIGVWDRRFRADGKTNLLISLAASLLTGFIMALISYRSFHEMTAAFITFALNVVIVFVLVLAALTVTAQIYKKRLVKLEQEDESDS